jgi:hypothetical protein
MLLVPRPVTAATLTWTGAVSQAAETAGNWSPAQIPAAGDDLVWSGAGGMFVNFGASAVQSSRSWAFTGEKQIFTHKAHTITQGIRLTASGRLTLSTIDSIVVNGDIENEGTGQLTIQQGCPVVGVDSARFTSGFLSITGLNSRLLANHVLMASGQLSVVSGARLVASQSLTLRPGAQVAMGSSNSSITAPALSVPSGSNLSLFQGRVKLAGELALAGGMSIGGGGLVEASTVRLLPTGQIAGHGTLAAALVMEQSSLAAESGKLTVGRASDPAGVVLDGTVEVRNLSELECLSASPVTLPGYVTVTNGTLRSPSGFVLGDGGYFLASGVIAGDLAVLGGEFSVFGGLPAVPEVVTIQGNWSQGSGGSRVVYLSKPGATWEADSVVVTGQAEPGGTLVIYYDDFVGTPANPIPFLFYASRPAHRVFEVINLNGLPVTDELQIVYHADRAEIVFSGSVAVDDPARRPATLALGGRSGRAAALVLSLPDEANVKLGLFDVSGREVARLHDGSLKAGTHRFELSGPEHARSLASGVYFARASARDGDGVLEHRTAKVVLQR